MKPKFSDKLKYKSDKIMSKGTPALITMLVISTVLFLLLFGLILYLFAGSIKMPDNPNPAIWDVFIHMIDQGTITGDDSGNVGYIIIMVIITLAGLIINSILIGTISNAIDSKLSSLKEGKSTVIENNHTVIIGLNDAAFTIIDEKIKANENIKKGCIVVFDNLPQEEMLDTINLRFPNTKNTEIICRSGNTFELGLLDMCSITTAKSVVITYDDDIDVMKQLMVISKYIQGNDNINPDFHVVALIHEKKNVKPAKIIGGNFVEIVYFGNALSRLIANSCRYPGISKVFVDFFDFDGDEIYYESFKSLDGMKFKDVIMSFKNSAVIGLVKNGVPLLNPPMDTVYDFFKGDQVIHLAEDDNVSFPSDISSIRVNITDDMLGHESEKERNDLLVLGYNSLLFDIITEFDKYVGKGSKVTIATFIDKEDMNLPETNNLSIEARRIDIDDYDNLGNLLEEGYNTVLLPCNLDVDDSKSDASILTKLVVLRSFIKEKNLKVNIISEMRSIENQKIFSDELIDDDSSGDFVVGSNIMSLILSQLSENRNLRPLFEDLLDDSGSELYMKKVTDYIKVDDGTAVDMYTLQRIAERRNEIVIGYNKKVNGKHQIMLNPQKDVFESFTNEDLLIVVAEHQL